MTGLYSYYRLKRLAFLESFQNCVLRCSEEDIHDLRVSIKKMRAVLAFIRRSSENSDYDLAYLENLKTLFKVAGDLRESQINANIIRSFQNSIYKIELITVLNSDIQAEEKMLSSTLSAFDFNTFSESEKSISSEIEKYPEDQIEADLVNFITEKIQKVKDLTNKAFEDKLHRIRKEVKIISEILRLKMALFPIKEDYETSLTIKELSDSIGRWHDLDEFLKWMNKFPVPAKNQKVVKQSVDPLKKEIINLKNQIKNAVIKRL